MTWTHVLRYAGSAAAGLGTLVALVARHQYPEALAVVLLLLALVEAADLRARIADLALQADAMLERARARERMANWRAGIAGRNQGPDDDAA